MFQMPCDLKLLHCNKKACLFLRFFFFGVYYTYTEILEETDVTNDIVSKYCSGSFPVQVQWAFLSNWIRIRHIVIETTSSSGLEHDSQA